MGNEWEFQVALSFAGEQRAYVEAVSDELTMLGISHFYDNKEKSALWGKNLTQYLDDVYFAKSRFVVAFVSEEYRDKVWTKWEMRSAQDRALRQPDEYILPVYFDDIRLSGLVGSLGRIDAKSTSPAELARLIFTKVTGVSLDSDQLTQPLPRYHATSPARVNFHQTEGNRLRELYNRKDTSIAVAVLGEKGLGKRTVIDCFLDEKDCVLHITPDREPHYQYEPLVDALGSEHGLFVNTNDLALPERLTKCILNLCQKRPLILYFEGMDQYERGLILFLLDLCNEILLRHPDYQTFILFEYDSDSERGKDLGNRFCILPPAQLEFIPFERLGPEELQFYLRETFGEIKIGKPDLDYILKSSYGNIMYLNIIMNYLKMRGIFKKCGDQFICEHIVEGALADVLGKYIQQRYDRLDQDLKEVLTKSTIIGNTFSSELLSKPFGILHAEELLDKIESLSMLIKREGEAVFSFESPDSLRIISASIREEEGKQWHRILAKYFVRRLERLKCSPLALDQKIIYLCSAMRHYKYAGDYEDAVTFSRKLVEHYMAISDYACAYRAIEETRSLMDMIDLDNLPVEDLEYELSILEAECLMDQGEFARALSIYLSCIAEPPKGLGGLERSTIELDCALCHYMNGETTAALERAGQVKAELESSAPDSYLYCKALSLLASFNDCTGKEKEKRHYYIQALTICRDKKYESDYYRLLKKASMVYDESIALGMYPAASAYFEAHHQIKNMAELQHNIATDRLYLNDEAQILSPLTKSLELFSSFGSTMIHYPMNTQGIYQAIFEHDYQKALETFQRSLSYQPECYSQVVLRVNMASCCLKLNRPEAAKALIIDMDGLLARPENSDVYDYKIYRRLVWGLYHYWMGEYERCHALVEECAALPELDPRFAYMCNFLNYLTKKHAGLQTERPRETPCKPVLKQYFEQEILFFTLRFFE